MRAGTGCSSRRCSIGSRRSSWRLLSALGVRPYRPTATATAALLTGHQALLRGFTFTNHEELSLLVCAYVLALFPAADGFAWPRRRGPTAPPETYAAAVHAMSLLLLLPYCGIAARRLVRGTPDVFTGDSLAHWLGSLDALDRDAFGIGPWVLRRPGLVAFLKAGFVITTVFELLAPLCLIVPRLRRAWIPVIGSMHRPLRGQPTGGLPAPAGAQGRRPRGGPP
jgi:hypothetical protein